MTAPNCSLVLDGKPKTASQITLGDLADEDTELFAIIGNTYCSLKDVSINGTNLGKKSARNLQYGNQQYPDMDLRGSAPRNEGSGLPV